MSNVSAHTCMAFRVARLVAHGHSLKTDYSQRQLVQQIATHLRHPRRAHHVVGASRDAPTWWWHRAVRPPTWTGAQASVSDDKDNDVAAADAATTGPTHESQQTNCTGRSLITACADHNLRRLAIRIYPHVQKPLVIWKSNHMQL